MGVEMSTTHAFFVVVEKKMKMDFNNGALYSHLLVVFPVTKSFIKRQNNEPRRR
jgi:hypothetical protein